MGGYKSQKGIENVALEGLLNRADVTAEAACEYSALR
jgi:hypothetical protein